MDILPLLTRQLIVLVCVYLSLLNSVAIADVRQVVDIYYDLSGNLVEKDINVTLNALAPVVSAINPSVVRRTPLTAITIDDSALKNIQISTDDPELTVSNVESANGTVNLTNPSSIFPYINTGKIIIK